MNQRIPAPAVWATLVLTGCVSYEPAPIEPARVLENLEAMVWTSLPASADSVPVSPVNAEAVGPRELAAFAVTTNPVLAAVRAEVGVRQALLVEAGLLPDPQISWDAMDVLAPQIVNGSSSSVEALAGFGLMFPLLRPGERGARIGAAEWRSEEARQRVAAAEWSLTRDIHVAYEEVQASARLVAQTQVLTQLASSTRDYFQRARDAGAATAIQANLALGELQAIRLDSIRAEARLQQARQSLNALLGLPPSHVLELRDAGDPSETPTLMRSTEELTAHAVQARPDLKQLLARYQAAEEGVRLAISKQYPQVSIGTGIALSLPFFSRFGGPAMRTALARREQLGREFTAAVHAMRGEIAATHTQWELARREVDLVENELLPNAEQNLELSREAFRAGEVTLLETLALQRALVEARTRRTESRAERSKRAWALMAASGFLLGEQTENTTTGDSDEEVR